MFILAFTILDEYIFGKFLSVDGIDDIYETTSSDGRGGAAYLIGLEINNLQEFILFSPLKSIYFLLSPLPWDWRGIYDVFTFFFDSMLYLITIISFVKYRKSFKNDKSLSIAIILMIIG